MTSPSRGSGSPAAEQQLDSQQFSGRGRIEEARSSETPLNGSWRVEQTAGAVKTRSMASEDERRREKHESILEEWEWDSPISFFGKRVPFLIPSTMGLAEGMGLGRPPPIT
ncbi:hypothetical protein B0H14DRAFT_2562312 [Mycena olivaceomarginata]|nr:hypothetical protein B0H14DRAFT_2562312 [Mycena olivaceomarginata]